MGTELAKYIVRCVIYCLHKLVSEWVSEWVWVPVPTQINSTSLGNIKPCGHYCMKTSHSHIFTTGYGQVFWVSWGIVERWELPRHLDNSKGDSIPGFVAWESGVLLPNYHSLIWRPSRVADTPPLLPISRYGYCLFVADVCLCSEVLQPGGSWSSSGSGSM